MPLKAQNDLMLQKFWGSLASLVPLATLMDQGKVVTASPPKRLAQLRSSLTSDLSPTEAGCQTF